MADVGLGQLLTATGRARSRKLKDAVSDSHYVLEALEKHGGIRRIDGGRSIVDEGITGQNSTVKWVGEAGSVSLSDQKVLDAAEFYWKYLMGSVTITHAERLQNSGGSDTKLVNLVGGKFEALEASMMNEFHEGLGSLGTAEGGLQIGGIPHLISTTPTTGSVGGIDRSSANATWYQNGAFNTATEWNDGAVDSGNVLRAFGKALNATMVGGKLGVQLAIAGSNHFEALDAAIGAKQTIVNVSGEGKAGFDKLFYRGIPVYLAGGINYSGATLLNAKRTYFLCVKPGGVNLVYHEGAEFEMLDPVNSANQAAYSRLMLTMANMTLGPLAKRCYVLFDE